MMYYPTAYVTVIFPRFDAAGRMKTDLMSELECLQLLAELGEESLVHSCQDTLHCCDI